MIMKKIFFALLIMCLTSCTERVLDDDHATVILVAKSQNSKCYYVKTNGRFLNSDGNFCFYTKTKYQVGDKIKIVKE